MSEANDGRIASDEVPSLDSSRIKLKIHVTRSCNGIGYRATKAEILRLDVWDLTSEARATLRRHVESTRRRVKHLLGDDIFEVPGVIDLTLGEPGMHLASVSVSELSRCLGNVAEFHRCEDGLKAARESLDGLLTEAVATVFRGLPPGPANFAVDDYGYPILDPNVRDRILAQLPAGFAAIVESHAGLVKVYRSLTRQGSALAAKPKDWTLEDFDAYFAASVFRNLDMNDHLAAFSAHSRACGERREEAKYALSPKGLVEAVLKDLGTPSQVERWHEGFLPPAEADAVIARHVFRDILATTEPEVRLDKDAITAAVRQAEPAASVTKISFVTEEADGLDEDEWTAFKAVRAGLPPGAAANVVRTVASIQTASHGVFSARRALATLKGSFAERDIRIRVDLGTGLRVQQA